MILCIKSLLKRKEPGFLLYLAGMRPTGPSQFLESGNAFNTMGIPATPDLDIKDQYYLPAIGYTPLSDPNSAWNVVDATQKNVVVAVVDSGLDLTHPDGPQYLWTTPGRQSRLEFCQRKHRFHRLPRAWHLCGRHHRGQMEQRDRHCRY